MFAVGWGEGYHLAAAWLNEQDDITGALTVSRMITSFNPYLRDGAQAFFPSAGELRSNAGYLVVYISEVQGGPPPPPADRFYGKQAPLHVVQLHGVEYAWIYDVPSRVVHPVGATFGPSIRLHGFDRNPPEDPVQPGQALTYRLLWRTDAPLPQDDWLFARLIGPDGQTYAQLDLPLPTSAWQTGRYTPAELPLTVPTNAPAGTYQVVVGLYELESGQRLPLTDGPPADPALSGGNALLLDTMVVE
ncbi:MAG: hypothetical protein HC914_21560 [Chloroflexaceae bacterium]|nr:hypothetical protein [Chloroflexaceae bacterium]